MPNPAQDQPPATSVRVAVLDLLHAFGMTSIFGNPGSTELPFFREFPSDFRYVKIALILGALTALEVSTYFFEMSTAWLVATLFPMMIVKFGIVAAYFMHLKFDHRVFRRAFITGIVLAIFVYVAALATFQFFSNGFSTANQ